VSEAVVIFGPTGRIFASVSTRTLSDLKNAVVVPFMFNREIYAVEPTKIDTLYSASVSHSAEDIRVLFGRYAVKPLHALPYAKKLPHKKRVRIRFNWRDHVEDWLSMYMTKRPRYYSVRSLEKEVTKFFGDGYSEHVSKVLGMWVNTGTVDMTYGHTSGVQVYKYVDIESGLHKFKTPIIKYRRIL